MSCWHWYVKSNWVCQWQWWQKGNLKGCTPKYIMRFEEVKDITKRHVRSDVPQGDAILLKDPPPRSLYGFLLRFKMPKAKPLMEWTVETVLPREVWKLALAIEEKDDNQIESDLMANRHMARRGCFDNVLCFITKNSGEVHSYYVIRCQYRQLKKHKQWLRLRYPNAVHRWCRFKREVIKTPNYCKNHFSITEEKRALFETALDENI